MKIQKEFKDLINERISFCNKHVNRLKITKENSETLSMFEKALVEFEYCKKLIKEVETSATTEAIDKLKKQSVRVLVKLWNAVNEEAKIYLSQEYKDYNKKQILLLNNIFSELGIELKHIELEN